RTRRSCSQVERRTTASVRRRSWTPIAQRRLRRAGPRCTQGRAVRFQRSRRRRESPAASSPPFVFECRLRARASTMSSSTTWCAAWRAKGYLAEAVVNYLALLGWSPRPGTPGGRTAGDDAAELLPVDELARRFSLDRVGHSAGVFDEEKLAWANRHYLKMADPLRIAELSVPYFNQAGVKLSPDARGIEFLGSAMAMATASVDRLDQVPAR